MQTQQQRGNRRVQWTLIPVLALTLAACGGSSSSSDDGTSDKTAYDATTLLKNTADHVIHGIYADMKTKAGNLESAVTTLEGNINESNVNAARSAWVDVRVPWEKSEAFLYGPVASQGYDPRLDSWPLDVQNFEDVLSNNNASDIDQSLIDSLQNNSRGFHAAEFLLWSDSSAGNDVDDPQKGQDTAAHVATVLNNNADRMAYLKEVSVDIRQTADALAAAWTPADPSNFGAKLKNAGAQDNSTFSSQRAAVQQVINGMIVIADEVGSGKIAGPFGNGTNPDATAVESKHSFNSRADFKNDIRGIRHIYLGDYDGRDGVGITDYVQKVGASSTDQAVRNQIEAAIQAIDQIPQPFRDAISGSSADKQAVRNAIDEVIALRDLLQSDVLTLLDDTDFAQ